MNTEGRVYLNATRQYVQINVCWTEKRYNIPLCQKQNHNVFGKTAPLMNVGELSRLFMTKKNS